MNGEQLKELLDTVSEKVRKETAREIITEFAKMLIDDFTKSADIQDFVTVKKTLRNLCPAKVNKIKKKLAKQYGVEVE